MAGFVIIPALIMGAIIGLIEFFFVHQDEAGMRWFVHALHTIPVMMIFIFISMNLNWALGLIGIEDNFTMELIARIIIGIIAMVKIAGAAAIVSSTKIGEKKIHILIIGILVMAAPYLWDYVIKNLVGAYINVK